LITTFPRARPCSRYRYEAEEPLFAEERAQRRKNLAVKAAEPPVAAFAADDDEGAKEPSPVPYSGQPA
jgi:hypothetical protein